MRRLQISNRGRIALFSVVFGIPLYVVGRISPVPPLEPLRGEIGDVLVARARRDLLDQVSTNLTEDLSLLGMRARDYTGV
jgi:hypothetical protein